MKDEIITYACIYEKINAKRALLGITEKDFSTHKATRRPKSTGVKYLVGEWGVLQYKDHQ